MSCQKPCRQRQQGEADDRWHEDTGNPVRNPGNGGLCGRCITDHFNDLRKCRVLSHPGRPGPDIAGLVDGGGRHQVALGLVHRNGFAGQRRFIHRRAALLDAAVHRDCLSRADNEEVADLHCIDGHGLLLAVPQQYRGLRRQPHEALQCIRGTPLGHGLQHFPDSDQRGDHGCRFEVQVMHNVMHGRHISIRQACRQYIQRRQGIDEGGAGAEGHQCVHIRTAVQKALKARDEEFPVDDHDNDGQQHFRHGEGRPVSEEGRHRPAQHSVSHGQIHNEKQEGQRLQQPAPQLRCLMILQRFLL